MTLSTPQSPQADSFSFLGNADFRKCYLTYDFDQLDGIGSQVLWMLGIMLVCRDFGINYVHTPFKNIGHRPDLYNEGLVNFKGNWEKKIRATQRLQDDWDAQWEAFFNLGKNERLIEDLDKAPDKHVQVADLEALASESPNENTLFQMWHCKEYIRQYPERLLSMRRELQEKYYSTPKTRYDSHQRSDRINVAVHIRRGDFAYTRDRVVDPNDSHVAGKFLIKALSGIRHVLRKLKRQVGYGYTSDKTFNSNPSHIDNSYFIKVLSGIRRVLSEFNTPVSICVYSEGEPEEFDGFGEDVNFHLNGCPFTAFHNMMHADVFVRSHSQFSRLATLYSDGVVVNPWPRTPAPLLTDKDGRLNEQHFRESIAHHLSALQKG